MKPDFNCCYSFKSRVDKVATGTLIFVPVISNVPAPVELVMAQIDDYVKIR